MKEKNLKISKSLRRLSNNITLNVLNGEYKDEYLFHK